MRELTAVIPVYNEEARIAGLVRDWAAVVEELGIDYEIILLNDGSRDGTADVLKQWHGNPRIMAVNKENEGHGPTILRGYALAVARSEWVFQLDCDDEIKAANFPALWARRAEADFVFACRANRVQNRPRRLVTQVSAIVVRVLGGRGVCDVNVPFRLMRAGCLAPMLALIPPDTFAPNVAISGLAAKHGRRIVNVPTPCESRESRSGALMGWKLLATSSKAACQVAGILARARSPR